MFGIPDSTDFASIGFKLIELLKCGAGPFCLRLIFLSSPEISKSIDEDLPKPIAKCAGLLIMVKLGQLLHDDRKHFLNQVVGVSTLNVIST